MYINYGDRDFFEHGVLVDSEHSDTVIDMLRCEPYTDAEDLYQFARISVDIEDSWIDKQAVMDFIGMSEESFDPVQYAIGCSDYYSWDNFGAADYGVSYDWQRVDRETIENELKNYLIAYDEPKRASGTEVTSQAENGKEYKMETVKDNVFEKSPRDWYMDRFPTDDLGQYIPEDLTWNEIGKSMTENDGYLDYDLLGRADDSIVRERLQLGFEDRGASGKEIDMTSLDIGPEDLEIDEDYGRDYAVLDDKGELILTADILHINPASVALYDKDTNELKFKTDFEGAYSESHAIQLAIDRYNDRGDEKPIEFGRALTMSDYIASRGYDVEPVQDTKEHTMKELSEQIKCLRDGSLKLLDYAPVTSKDGTDYNLCLIGGTDVNGDGYYAFNTVVGLNDVYGTPINQCGSLSEVIETLKHRTEASYYSKSEQAACGQFAKVLEEVARGHEAEPVPVQLSVQKDAIFGGASLADKVNDAVDIVIDQKWLENWMISHTSHENLAALLDMDSKDVPFFKDAYEQGALKSIVDPATMADLRPMTDIIMETEAQKEALKNAVNINAAQNDQLVVVATYSAISVNKQDLLKALEEGKTGDRELCIPTGKDGLLRPYTPVRIDIDSISSIMNETSNRTVYSEPSMNAASWDRLRDGSGVDR